MTHIERGYIRAYSLWCGPNVLASVTRLSRYTAAGILWMIQPPDGRLRGTTRIATIAEALGTEVYTVASKPAPTVARWLRENRESEAILLASKHFIHVRDGEIIADGGSPMMRARVRCVIFIGSGPPDDHAE